MKLVCFFFGHQWKMFSWWVIGTDGHPDFWINDECTRCGAIRNPLIGDGRGRKDDSA